MKDALQVIKDNLEAVISMFGEELINNPHCTYATQAMAYWGLISQIAGRDKAAEYLQEEVFSKFPTIHLFFNR